MLKSLWLWWKQRSFHKLQKKRVEDIFSGIYKRNEWGGVPGTFYSGDGTHHPDTQQYIEQVRKFITAHSINDILEIGCGDFYVSSQVVKGLDVAYTGGDVVDELITHHQKNFQTDKIKFKKINAIEDALPVADLIIIRQVLQHLSNEHIQKILSKMPVYRYALITEHIPVSPPVHFNLDKITGPHIRMKFNSGVFIDQHPFLVPNTRILFEYPHDDIIKGRRVPAVLRTYLVEQP
ncbi:MAG: class I SAM-dependent methyltransferase [Cytophagales bacterium]|nr:class I SAM-dependent methyltransferase [Cytophagales bacterium]